jgi:hypothetical protein
MYDIVFLLEEKSMKELLMILLPKIVPESISYKCISHEGKKDLEKSIPIKLRAFPEKTQFVVIRDKDSHDCLELKQQLIKLCSDHGRTDTLIRIDCHELESWYIGDLFAVSQGLELGEKFVKKNCNKSKFRDPDKLANAKDELTQITDNKYMKIDGSRNIAKYITIENNKSHSFQVFISGLKKLISKIEADTSI